MAKNLNIESVGSKFFTGSQETKSEDTTEKNQDNVKVVEKIVYVERAPETKSYRLNLLIKPSTREALIKRAESENISLNALINNILEESISK